MNKFIFLGAIILSACAFAVTDIIVPMSIDSVETKRAKDVLVRIIQYNTDKSELRLESIKPIKHELLDVIDIKSFTVNGRSYEFSACDELAVNSVAVEQNQVLVEFECFVPKATAVIANCAVPIQNEKFAAMRCTRQNDP
jgi:hypothetical protein